jgi:hypothetical protein
MKHNRFATALVVLLFVGGSFAAIFAVRYGFRTRELRTLQARMININNQLAIAQSLLNDTLEYSKRNPAIDPLLKSFNMKTNAVPGATNSESSTK